MPHTQSVWIGSGIAPSIESSLPGGCNYGTSRQIKHVDAQPIAILNVEDLSAFRGPGNTKLVQLTGGSVKRLDRGLEGRRSIAIANTDQNTIVYFGFRNTITTTVGDTGGYPIFPRTAISIDCTNRYQIYGKSDSNVVVGILELV